ncbi:MAG TPA: hypothetical protein VFC56_08445 [Stellaceae bacterium]|nr:hypothetical protein [Stellaceae bacterium]
MSEALPPQWTRLRDGARFVGDLWPASDERQRREILVSALMSGAVRMRARFAARPRHPDGRPMLPSLERNGALGTTTPLPDAQVFLRTDPRLVTWDFSAGRVVICPIYDDKSSWGLFNFEPHFPGGATVATGRFLSVELDDIEFDGNAASAYIVENLLPDDATPNNKAAPPDESRAPATPQADGSVIGFPHGTAALRDAVRDTLEELKTPGKHVPWQQFCDRVRARCNVSTPQVRGYGDKTITRIVRAIEACKSE